MFNLRRIETIYLPSKVENASSLDISQTGHISITTSAFIVIYQIPAHKEIVGKGISCRKYIILPSQYTLKHDLGIDITQFLYELPRDQYYESILMADLTPDLDFVQQYLPKFVKSWWSPPRCDKNYDCALATLSSNGVIEIYIKTHDKSYNTEFSQVCNVTQKYTEILKITWQDVDNRDCTEKLKELINRANEVKAKCVTWSSHFPEGYYILVIGHFSGKITFWKVRSQRESMDLTVDFLQAYQTNMDRITCLIWKPVGRKALLFIGSKDGQVHTLSLTISSNGFDIQDGFLQIKKDNLTIHSIHIMNTEFGHFIILVKVMTMIIISMNKLHESYEFVCNNIEILDVIIMDNHILVLTKTGVMKEVILNLTLSGIDIKWKHFYVDINTYMKCPLNMALSRNKTLLFMLTKNCKPKQSKNDLYSVDLHIFGNNESKCLEQLLHPPSKQLTYMWDCLELYRCSAIQTKNLLLENLQFETCYDKYDLYTLKVLLFVSKVCESLSDQLKEAPAIKPCDDVFSILYLKMMMLRMQYLLELYRRDHNLSTFHFQNLLILSNYIRQVVVEDIAKMLGLDDSTMDTIVDIIQKVKNINFTENSLDNCITCGEKLYDITCMPPHFESRCAISLMQISGIVKFKCILCNAVVHEKIASEVSVVICPFCDIPMVERTL